MLLGVGGDEPSPLALAAAGGRPKLVKILLDWCKIVDEFCLDRGLPAQHNLQKLLQQQHKECYNPIVGAAASNLVAPECCFGSGVSEDKSLQIINMLTEQVGNEPHRAMAFELLSSQNALISGFCHDEHCCDASSSAELAIYESMRMICITWLAFNEKILCHHCMPSWIESYAAG